MILDRRDGSVWGLITPHSIDRTLAAERNAEVAAIPLVRAVGGAIGAVEEPHVDVLARNVLDGGIGRFAERQSFSRVGDDPPDDRTTRIWDAETGQEITRIALDAAVTALAVHDGDIALGDALGRIQV